MMGETDDSSEREQIREILAQNIERLDSRVQDAWKSDMPVEAERLQLSRLRTLAHLSRQYRLLARDEDIDEMEAEVNLVQEAMALGEDEG